MAGMEGLGRLVDFSAALLPSDLSAGPYTGKRVSMKNTSGLFVVVLKGPASSGTDPGFTFKEATAFTSGTSQNMATPPAYFYKKAAASFAGSETWSQVTATFSSGTVTLTGEQGNGGVYVFDILSEDLSAGFDYIEIDAADAGTVAQLGGVLYVPHDLLAQRDPTKLAALST